MNINNGINQLKSIFEKKDFKEEVEFQTIMLALSFLSEVEKEADLQGINRKQLAEKVGTSRSYITQIMRGNKVPNLKILAALGLALGKKFDVKAVACVQERSKIKVYCQNEELDLPYLSSETPYFELSQNIPEIYKHEKHHNILDIKPRVIRERKNEKICV